MPIIIEDHDSRILKNNPLGDPHLRRTPVYVPPGYHDANDRYPSIYALAGFTGNGMMMLNQSAWDEPIEAMLDRLILGGVIRPMIVVMPDCLTRYGGSQYINSGATGNYEDYLIKELVPFIDSRYRTLPNRDYRAIAGKSSGGFGATLHGMRHPDVFGLVADHSGDKYFDFCYRGDFAKCLNALSRTGGLQKFMSEFPQPRPRPGAFFEIIAVAGMAACYSPNPQSAVGFDLPFDEHTGELRPDVWARWLEWDPINLIDRYADALRSLRLLYFECGTRDEYNLQYGARIFAKRLAAANIRHKYVEFDDGHRNLGYRYEYSFKEISDTLPMVKSAA